MKKDTREGVFFIDPTEGFLRYCRAGCPRPTTKPRAFRKPCRGRRSRRPVSAGCPPRGLPRATRSQRRQAPAPTSSTEGFLRYCRAGCPHPAASIGVLSYVDGGLRAGRPTTKPRAFRKPCRGRRLRRPVSAGCPPRGLPRAMRSQRRQAPAPTSSTEASCDTPPRRATYVLILPSPSPAMPCGTGT